MRVGLRFVALFVGVLWLATLVLLWPVLGTHYAGLPPGQASWVTALGFLVSYTVYGLTVIWAYHMIMGGATLRTPGPFNRPSSRRALLLGGIGVLAAIATGALIRRLYNLVTFSDDGTRYSGPDIQPITPNDRFYVVTKNVLDPFITPAVWRLEVTGLVERPQIMAVALNLRRVEVSLRRPHSPTAGSHHWSPRSCAKYTSQRKILSAKF